MFLSFESIPSAEKEKKNHSLESIVYFFYFSFINIRQNFRTMLSTVTYGCEAGAMSNSDLSKIRAVEMKFLRFRFRYVYSYSV